MLNYMFIGLIVQYLNRRLCIELQFFGILCLILFCMHAILFTSNVSFNVTGRRMGLGRPWAIPILFSIIAYMYLLLICEWKINLSYYYVKLLWFLRNTTFAL